MEFHLFICFYSFNSVQTETDRKTLSWTQKFNIVYVCDFYKCSDRFAAWYLMMAYIYIESLVWDLVKYYFSNKELIN